MADKVTSPHTSQITDYLYISAWPRDEHVDEIVALGVRLVLSMHWIRPTKTPSPRTLGSTCKRGWLRNMPALAVAMLMIWRILTPIIMSADYAGR